MNKLFNKIATITLGLAMAIGVGAAIGGKGSGATKVSAASAWQAHTGTLTSGTEYLIVRVDNSACMKPTNTSSSGSETTSTGGYSAVSFTASSGPDLGFTFTGTGTANQFYIKDGTTYVYASGTTNNGLGSKADGSGSNDSKWTVTETSTSGVYTIISASSRQISEYSTNWRSYSTTSPSRSNVKIYEKSKKTQTITASADEAYSDESITLTTNATTATWSITSGGSYGHLSSTSGKSVNLVGDAAGSVTVKAVASGYTDVTKTLTFTERPSGTYYDVTFNSNGGSSSPAKQSVKENETFTFPSPGTKAHYSFLGWSSDGGATKYATSAPSPAVVADITYTAYWQEDAKYTITYVKGDHGTGEDYIVSNQYAGSYTLVTFATAGFETADGYKFNKWSVGGTQYAEGASITISGNTTVTAVYSEVILYTLVTDPTTLADGTQFVLVDYASNTYRIAKGLNSYSHIDMNTITSATTVSGTTTGSTVETEEADVFTLVGSQGAWEIKRGNKYLKFTGTSNGNDSFVDSSSADTKFSIVASSDTNKLTINSNSRTNRAYRYNTSTGDLRNYSNTTQRDLYMYAIIPVSSDTTTALSVSACSDAHYSSNTNTWTGYDSFTLDVSSFTISCTTTKSTPADGYSFKGIGYMDGNNFVARDANFSSGNPTAADTRLCWKAKYPTTAGGSTYLTLYVLLSVSEDGVQSLGITGSMTNTSYNQNDPWDPSGFTVNAYYKSAPSTPVDVTGDVSWSYDPGTTASLSTTSVVCTASYGGKSVSSSSQTVSIVSAPVVIKFNYRYTSGEWTPTTSGSTFTDSAGNTATLTTDTTFFDQSSGNPMQIGKNADPATYIEVIIPFTKAGVEYVSATFCSNGASTSVSVYIYGDTDNDLLASGSVTGNSAVKIETSASYEKINAQRIKYRFVPGGTGVKIAQISYQLGATVTDFGTMVDLDILTPASNTQFKEGDTFSGAGLVLIATDNHEPPLTKNLTSGFKFGTAQGDDSYTGHEFTAADAAIGSFTVHVTATVGNVTMEVTYSITVTEVPTYSPVTDYSSLYEGAKVIIVSGTKAFGEFELNKGKVVSPVFTDDDITDSNGATEFTVRIYGGKFGLQFGTYFLALNGTNYQVHRNSTLSDAGAWTKDSSGIAANIDGWHLVLDTDKFVCRNDSSGTACSLYISDKAPKTDTLAAETYAYRYLHLRDYTEGDGSCMNDSANHYYSTAKTAYGNLSPEEKVEFAKLADAVARLQAWARANSETFDPSTKTFSKIHMVSILNMTSESTNATMIAIIVSALSIAAIGGYFFLRKKKEQ